MSEGPARGHPYLRLLLRLEAGEERRQFLPVTTLRRVLGKALVDRFCPFGRPLCQPQGGGPKPPPRELCRVAGECPYGVLFAASLTRRPPFSLFVAGAAGGGAAVEMTLYADAWRLYAWAAGTLVEALGRHGVGQQRVQWQVQDIWRGRLGEAPERLCGAALSEFPPALEPDRLHLLEGGTASEEEEAVTVELLSPARLIRDGRLLGGDEEVPFEVLVQRILDRFEGLYGSVDAELLGGVPRRDLERAASRVPLVEDATRWREVKDYSARSKSEMLFGGKVGRLRYGAGAGRFLPLLLAGEILHVGKNPAMGCGRMRVVAEGVAGGG